MKTRIETYIISFLLLLAFPALASESTYKCLELKKAKQLKEARACFLEHPSNIYAITEAAIISRQLKDKRMFEQLTQKLLSDSLASPKSYLLCAKLHAHDLEKYVSTIKEGLEHFKGDTILLSHMANYYFSIHNYKMVQATMDEIILHNNGSNEAMYFAKGYAYEMQKDTAMAMLNYNKSLSINPNYFEAYYNIGTMYYNEAVNLLSTASQMIKNDKYLQSIELANNELTKAIPYFEKAVELRPKNKEVLNTLRLIYYRFYYEDDYQRVLKQLEGEN